MISYRPEWSASRCNDRRRSHPHPWERSTGPRTAEGKLQTSLNAYKGAEREKTRALVLVRALNELISDQKDDLKRMR